MPKLGMNMAQKAIADDLYKRYGGMMTVADVARELGYNQRKMAEIWLDKLPCYIINKVRRWRVSDIARKIWECEDYE